jgi:hypothetical protein
MSDRKHEQERERGREKVQLSPPEITVRATILEVLGDCEVFAIVQYQRVDGVTGCSRVFLNEWDPMREYWPPAVGDVANIVIRARVTFGERPR